jgi:hypothetical protein
MPRAKRVSSQKEVLEQGEIYFFYRSKVKAKEDKEHQPQTLADIHRFYILLHPENKPLYRLCILGRKHMPDIQAHEKFWITVEKVTKNRNELKDYLQAETYQTKTRGERLLPQAMPCGEGSYAITQSDKQTYLTYRLVRPKQKGEIQEQFNVPEQAIYVLSVKNQAIAGSKGRRADFPKYLQDKLGSLRFVPLETSDFLDYPNAELLLIGANMSAPAEVMEEGKSESKRIDSTKILKQ